MLKHVPVVGVLAAGAFAMTGVAPERATSKPADHRPRTAHVDRDSRRHTPGTHRAKAAELAVRNRIALAESRRLELRKRIQAALPSVPAMQWVNLGPTDAQNEFNFVDINGVDSGRPNTILVDPRDANVVYMGVSGGGLWKSFDFLAAAGPTWSPATDTMPNLAIGALALDEDNPDAIYVGNGDFIDASGNTVMKSVDGGSTWTTPVELDGTYPAPNSSPASVNSVNSLAAKGDLVLAGTDVGLFTSKDGGKTFALVDLPNKNGAHLAETVWSVVSVGGGHYVASGLVGCDEQSPPPGVFGVAADPTACTGGNLAEIWYSADGATWSLANVPADAGRVTLAAGRSADPAHTAVYAWAGSVDSGASTVGFWRSMDGGQTWADATGTLANPTLMEGQNQDCADMNFGHDQSWYNQAIVVDPTNPDHVLVGGNLCGARTLNGTAASPKWELVSEWLPRAGGGSTANGQLPYVHADWHTATSVAISGGVRTFAGTDGGIFSSTDLFQASTTAEKVTWQYHNKGLVTHLMYALGSGDPATANPFVLFAGLQDNGTRYRADVHNPSVFNQPVGGDGIGCTVHVATSGTTYWASVEFGHSFCKPSATVDCKDGQNWNDADPPGVNIIDREAMEGRGDKPDGEDTEPFFVHYANVETDTTGQSVLTHTTFQIWVAIPQGTGMTWKAISQDLTPPMGQAGTGFSNVVASRSTPGLYGAAGRVSAAPFFVSTTGNTKSTWVVAKPVQPTGTAARMLGASGMDFPAVLPPGKTPGQVFIGSFTGTMNDGNPPPDDKGHLYRTLDGGQTWTSIVGADPAHRLPNVAVYVVKYDPVTPTTIYAGTDLGVYLSLDDGATWNRMGEGFPMIPVRDLYVAKNQDFIRAATYGRGLWEIYPSAAANQGALGNGDYDRNLRLDWIDLAAMATRVGRTPMDTSQPFYSWIMDMTGAPDDPPLQKIDDGDLSALLAKFGGHP